MPSFHCYPWQEHNWQLLVRLLQRQRLPHGLLIHGIAGSGKLDFALSWAHYLLCQSPDKHTEQKSCGCCNSCLFLDAGYHPDLCFIHQQTSEHTAPFLAVKQQAISQKPAASNHSSSGSVITVDQIHQIRHFLLKKPHQTGSYKIVIIDPAEAMNTHAANALLKILEEPPEACLFLLLSQQKNLLPQTITSRTWPLAMLPPDEKTACSWLTRQPDMHINTTDQIGLIQCRLTQLLRMHGGAVLQVKKMLLQKQQDQQDERQDFLKALQGITEQPDQTDLVALAAKLAKIDFTYLLNWWRIWTEDMLRYALTRDTQYLLDQDQSAWYQAWYQQVTANAAHRASCDGKNKNLFIFHGKLNQYIGYSLARININKTMAWQSLLLHWHALVR